LGAATLDLRKSGYIRASPILQVTKRYFLATPSMRKYRIVWDVVALEVMKLECGRIKEMHCVFLSFPVMKLASGVREDRIK
jgi:hypothetical protein